MKFCDILEKDRKIILLTKEGTTLKKDDIEQLREKLNNLISDDSDYSKILKISQELDIYVTEFTKTQMSNKNTTYNNRRPSK